jgi:protoheme IX farnesyltransferase
MSHAPSSPDSPPLTVISTQNHPSSLPKTSPSLLRDLLALIKPRITLMAMIMALGGFALAPSPNNPFLLCMALCGTALAVGAANTLNMYWERDSDRFMDRTRLRPLPDGRMPPTLALAFGITLQLASILLLSLTVNLLTAALGTLAFILYVFVYTPLKKRSPVALIVGAIPGAMPSLMGWTAATDLIDSTGLLYTAILFFWQMPHFLAIAMFRKDEYALANIKVTPLVHGEHSTKQQAAFFTICLVAVSLLLAVFSTTSWLYVSAASLLGLWFLWLNIAALREAPSPTAAWPRRIFVASLVYLPLITAALMVDVFMLR